MAGKDYLVVVAIDIGSSFSGYAYKFRTDDPKNQTMGIMCPQWISSNNKASGKTASSLLLNPDGSFNSFGQVLFICIFCCCMPYWLLSYLVFVYNNKSC